MKRFLIYLYIFLFAFNWSIKAQSNLVPNPSFEMFDTCPYNAGQIKLAKKWFNPTTGTTDFFNSCYVGPIYVGSPFNFNGYQHPYLGNGYCGLMLSETVTWTGTYREYAGVKLGMPLTSGTKYYTSLFINLADSSRYATSRIGLLFTIDSITRNYWDTIGRIPQVQNPFGNFITDKINWVQLKGEFVANGNEEFLYIGNFYAQSQTDTLYVTNGGLKQYNNFPYYYIDDICVSTDSLYNSDWTTGLTAHSSNDKLSFYPNPTNGKLFISSSNIVNYKFSIYNIMGKQCKVIELMGTNEIDLSELANGIYYIRIENNNLMETKKIVITKH